MRKVAIICLCTLFAGGSLFWFLAQSQSVSRALDKQLQRGPGAVIDFTEVAPFPWDRLYIFGPYTTDEEIHRCLGFRWQGVWWTSIRESDGVNLVVFRRGEKVAHWFEYPRHRGELGDLTKPRGYARGEARFRVQVLSAERRVVLERVEG